MRCNTAKHYLDMQLDRELKPKHQQPLDKHLGKCSSCRAWQIEAQKLHRLLGANPAPELPSWVHARIMDSVHRLDNKRPTFAHKLRLATAGAALAVIISIWAGMQIGIKSFDDPNTTTDSSVAAVSAAFGENTILENYLVIGDTYE